MRSRQQELESVPGTRPEIKPNQMVQVRLMRDVVDSMLYKHALHYSIGFERLWPQEEEYRDEQSAG